MEADWSGGIVGAGVRQAVGVTVGDVGLGGGLNMARVGTERQGRGGSGWRPGEGGGAVRAHGST